jgi:hypothetical protein
MNQTLEYVILSLAVFRLTRLVTTDTILEKPRELIWRKSPPEKNGIGYLVTCNWCTSIWASSLVFSMYKIATEPTMFVCSILALSGVAGIITSRTE